jgi:hypothetical protein
MGILANGIIGKHYYYYKRGPDTMSKNVDVNFDYRRAVLLLKNRINTPMDLIKIWAFCGPFHGDCPEIEKIPKSS